MSLNDINDADDYMSSSFVNEITDLRPGLVTGNLAKRYKNEQKTKLLNTLNKKKNKPLNVIQQEKRDEGLQNAIPKNNIGFQLLEKMGYKQNGGIGKLENGIKEPVPLNIKFDRKGLGHVDFKRKSKLMQDEDQLKKSKFENQWKESLKIKQNDREIEKDLKKSQAACEQLDSSLLIKTPELKFYWPLGFLPNEQTGGKEYSDSDDEYDDEYNNVKKEANNVDDDDVLFSATEKLQKLTDYLRSKHFYCIWCGIKFTDEEDLSTNCPGNDAPSHA